MLVRHERRKKRAQVKIGLSAAHTVRQTIFGVTYPMGETIMLFFPWFWKHNIYVACTWKGACLRLWCQFHPLFSISSSVPPQTSCCNLTNFLCESCKNTHSKLSVSLVFIAGRNKQIYRLTKKRGGRGTEEPRETSFMAFKVNELWNTFIVGLIMRFLSRCHPGAYIIWRL